MSIDKNVTIAVCSASGNQGFSVLKSLNKYKNYKLIFLTRSIEENQHKIKNLENPKNIEFRYCDFDRPLSIVEALVDVNWIFVNTNFWEHQNYEREVQQIKNIAIGCKSNNIQKIIFSTLENTDDYKIELENITNISDELKDKVKVPHFDSKGVCIDFFDDLNLRDITCFLHTSFYYQNFYGTIPFENKTINGVDYKIINIPFNNTKLPMMNVEDIGNVVDTIFHNFNTFSSECVGFASDVLNGTEIAKILTEETGMNFKYEPISYDEYRNTINEELANMFEFKNKINKHYCYIREHHIWNDYNVHKTSFREWIKQNKQNFSN